MASDKGEQMRERALRVIASCSDPAKLEQMIVNARRQGDDVVEEASRRRLYAVKPAAEPGTLEHDVWQSIYALEDTLKSERDRTTLLSRTRQSIARKGEADTVAGLVMKRIASDGFHMLLERKMPELTFEAVALRHPDRFDAAVLEAARARLEGAGTEQG